MIEQVINRRNMQLAYQHVLKNKGSAGVDGMQLTELTTYVKQHRGEVATALYKGRYKSQPILGVEIPKSNGKTRLLGIPTVVDRWLQQCVTQTITLKFELEFKEHSYGFRPNKNAHQCITQSQKYIHEGYQHMHILPPKFMKIRHYGILASRAKPKLRMQQMQLGIIIIKKEKKDWKEISKTKLNFDVDKCPCCTTGTMIRIISFDAHAPPIEYLKQIKHQTKMKK